MFENKLIVKSIENEGRAYPSQWSIKAIDNDNNTYDLNARYRSHRFYIVISDSNNSEWKMAMENQDDYRWLIHTFLPEMKEESIMTDKELKHYSKHILKW